MMPEPGCATLEDLAEFIGDCHRCALGESRTCLVMGSGDARARVMLIGEAPGRNEDLHGEPFIGAAGKFLDELLGHAGLRRDEVYIANVLKCRPPRNRDPQTDEVDCCTPFLREQIRLVSPEVIVPLGNFATRFILETTEAISHLRGNPKRTGEFVVLPVYHPAAAIYDRSKRDVLFADFEMLGKMLSGEVAVP